MRSGETTPKPSKRVSPWPRQFAALTYSLGMIGSLCCFALSYHAVTFPGHGLGEQPTVRRS